MSSRPLSDEPDFIEAKRALDALVRITCRWDFGGSDTGNGQKGRWYVHLFDVTKTDRLTVGYAYMDGKKYRVVIPHRWHAGVATRVTNRSRRTWDLEPPYACHSTTQRVGKRASLPPPERPARRASPNISVTDSDGHRLEG